MAGGGFAKNVSPQSHKMNSKVETVNQVSPQKNQDHFLSITLPSLVTYFMRREISMYVLI